MNNINEWDCVLPKVFSMALAKRLINNLTSQRHTRRAIQVPFISREIVDPTSEEPRVRSNCNSSFRFRTWGVQIFAVIRRNL